MNIVRGLLFAGAVAITTACGGAQAPRAPEAAIALTPPAPPVKQGKAPAVARPDNVGIWLHLDDPDALLDFAGLANAPEWASEAAPWLELVDTRQPVDVAFVVTSKHDEDFAVRVALRDARGLLAKAGKLMALREEGDRVHFSGKAPGEESTEQSEKYVCDFSGQGTDSVVCGTPRGVEGAAEWLRSAPIPRKDDYVLGGRGQPIFRVAVYAKAMGKLMSDKSESSDEDDKELARILADADALTLELTRDGGRLSFAAGFRLHSQQSNFAKNLFTASNNALPMEAFQRIWQDANAAVFVPGGGAIEKLVAEVFAPHKDGDDARTPKKVEATEKLLALTKQPMAAGYGVRADRARAALAAVRTAKDPQKATKALEKALDGYSVLTVAMDAAAMQPAVRSLAEEWNAEEAKNKPDSRWRDKWSVRAAPAKLGLAKGSFILDHGVANKWEVMSAMHAQTSATKPVAPTITTTPTLFVGEGGTTWVFTGADDAMVAENAKKTLRGPKPATTDEPLFKRPGVLFGGYISSIVGAFAMHRISIGLTAGMASGGSPMPSASTLTEIEHDLSAPKTPLPFVFYADKRDKGGLAAFEIEGDRQAFKEIGEHLGTAFSGSLALLVMAFALASGP